MNTEKYACIASIVLALSCAAAYAAASESSKPAGLTVDFMVSPANIGSKPSFSWKMSASRRGARQTAYRLRLGEKDGRTLWDTGAVESDASVAIPYAGKPLDCARRYVWSVEIRDERGRWSQGESAVFETGVFKEESWGGALWISAADAPVATKADKDAYLSAPLTACFAKVVENGDKEIKEVFWTLAGLGVFDATINGKPVSEAENGGFLKSGYTHPHKTKYSFTYDVTRLYDKSRGAKNILGAQVSSGWWRDKIIGYAGKKSALRAVLTIRYADGSQRLVPTDLSWGATSGGPVRRAGIYDGEEYDARIPLPEEAQMARAVANTEFKGKTLPMEGPGISLRRDLALAPSQAHVWNGATGACKDAYGKANIVRRYDGACEMTLNPGETLVVDFGQNASAVPEFVFSAAPGTRLVARPAEMLNDASGEKSRGCDGPGASAYFANYRRAKTSIDYTFAGGKATYMPRFTFFGYRYLSITATAQVAMHSLRSIPVTSIAKGSETGFLRTGSKGVNKLVDNILWGQYSNYLSVPTDCPQRDERQGWTADTQVFTSAAFCNANVYAFLRKWMHDLRDSQCDDGTFPRFAPIVAGKNTPLRLGWSDAGVVVPYTIWRQTGDKRAIDENWEAMRAFANRAATDRYTSESSMNYQWADWLSFEKYESHLDSSYAKDGNGKRKPTDGVKRYWRFLGECHTMLDAEMLAEMAHATGRGKDEKHWKKIREEALSRLRAGFTSKEDGMLIADFRDMQTPALFALKCGIVRGEAARKTAEELLRNIEEHGGCLQTGFLGTAIIMDVLTKEAGSPKISYSLLLQRKNPSWLYSVDQGATTIWERWDSYTKAKGFGPSWMNSFNHYAYGSVLSWMYSTMAGIRAAEPGYKRLTLAPLPDRRIGRVEARLDTPYGQVKSAWRYEGKGWKWDFTIPPNTVATVVVPGKEPREYASGSYSEALGELD